jgi:hypothetical protein
VAEHLKKLNKLVLENLVFYDAPVNEQKVKMFAAELADLPIERLAQAFAAFRQEKGRRQMPMPADLRARVQPTSVSDESIAIEAVSRVVTAISKFGPYRQADAKEYVGELGWAVVHRQGGWQEVCQVEIVGVFQSQALKVARAVLEQSRAGLLDRAPELPEGPDKAGLSKLDDPLALIPKRLGHGE